MDPLQPVVNNILFELPTVHILDYCNETFDKQILTGSTEYKQTVQTPDDYKFVSFDVKSLFTSLPIQLALDCIDTVPLKTVEPFVNDMRQCL